MPISRDRAARRLDERGHGGVDAQELRACLERAPTDRLPGIARECPCVHVRRLVVTADGPRITAEPDGLEIA